MTGYDFHPEARFDLDEIWEFIRADNLAAADMDARASPHGLCASFWSVNI
jgi:hypothetical protein